MKNDQQKRAPVTYAFVDAANILYRSGGKSAWKVDLKKLLKYLKERYGASRIFYFTGSDSENIKQAKLHHRMSQWGYEMRLNAVKRFLDAQGHLYLKADVDSRMTFEMMYLTSQYDRAVVLTGDGDFYWILQYLLENKERVWLLASPQKTARELKQLFGQLHSSFDDVRAFIEFTPLKK